MGNKIGGYRVTEEDIKKRILNKNPNVDIIDINRIRKKSKTRIMVKLKCPECGIVFERDLGHLTDNYATCLCGHCAQKHSHDNRKKNNNDKYIKMMEKLNISPLEEITNLYADDIIEVEDNDTHFRFLWKISRNVIRAMIFQPNGDNYKNFRYNLLKHAEINGYTCQDIITTKNNTDIEVICECGNHYICNYSKFLNGQFRCNSCAAQKSKYESIFESFLQDNNIEYYYQYRISSCKYKKPLPFDFLIVNPRILVEIQGEQHYRPIRFRCQTQEEAEKRFKEQQIRDKIKEDFCKEKDIPLLIISYKEIRNNEFKPKVFQFIQTHTE